MVVKRTVSSIIVIAVVAMTLMVDWLCGLMATVVILVGLYEFFTMLENKGMRIYKYFGMGIGAIIPLSIAFRFEPTKTWELFFIVIALLFLIIMQLKRRQHSGTIVDISMTIFGILYVAWFGSFFVKIRYLPNGLLLLAGLIIITKLGDIGAFLVGSRFGRSPLIPRISPKKSVEGAIGGLVFSIGAALASKVFLPFSYGHLVFLGAFLGALGQVGDLSESLMKRDCQVKDSSNIIPGIGGVLDLIDSLLFTAPVFYFYLSITLP
ncbi:MAG: phosphatidate cytidylyltransferase [Candidatus Omnitrophota bacterium]|jgi:phosphatidate cytidylyltransferase